MERGDALKAAKHRYYLKNKEKCKERVREWRAHNIEKSLAYQREYAARNKEKLASYRKAYFEENQKKYAADGARLREARKNAGYSMAKLARIIGVSNTSVSYWESGRVPIPWEDVLCVFPQLKDRNRRSDL